MINNFTNPRDNPLYWDACRIIARWSDESDVSIAPYLHSLVTGAVAITAALFELKEDEVMEDARSLKKGYKDD